jgi:hypothetical protein
LIHNKRRVQGVYIKWVSDKEKRRRKKNEMGIWRRRKKNEMGIWRRRNGSRFFFLLLIAGVGVGILRKKG